MGSVTAKGSISEQSLSKRRDKQVSRLHVDKLQPFLIFHKFQKPIRALVAEKVAITSGNYCLFDETLELIEMQQQKITDVFEKMASCFSRNLLIELVEDFTGIDKKHDSPSLSDLYFLVEYCGGNAALQASETIALALDKADLRYRDPMVETQQISRQEWQKKSVVLPEQDVELIRITIPSIYYQSKLQKVYPELLELVSAAVYDALLKGVFAFAGTAQLGRPSHYRAYGRSVLVKAAKHIDQQLDSVDRAFDFLLSVTPINSEQCWQEFEQSNFSETPQFKYRPLTISTAAVKRRLHGINVDIIEDPVLISIFQEKQRELDHQLTMLQLRNQPNFKNASSLVYPDVTDDEYRIAVSLVEEIDNSKENINEARDFDACLDCYQLHDAATQMVNQYQYRHDDFTPDIIIRDDVPSGLLVSGSQLIISRHSSIPFHRVEALLSHEIGVHLVTYFAGLAQPLKIFRSGLAGYEGIQEGLGVFAEFLVGGLTKARLMLLAGRVIATRSMLENADFIQAFRCLVDNFNFRERQAYNITMRIYRCGGLAKDAIYLRGLLKVLKLLEKGASMDIFWIGKIAPDQLPDIKELVDRELIIQGGLRPLFLESEAAKQRIHKARKGLRVVELLDH